MFKKDNILVNKIIENSKKYPNKKIIYDKSNSLTYSQLISCAIANSKKIEISKSDFIPILVDRNISTVVSILSVIFANKIFCPISNNIPNERINLFLNLLKSDYLINCSKKKNQF